MALEVDVDGLSVQTSTADDLRVEPRIHLSRAVVGDVEERFVLDALRSGWIAPLGPDVDAFEQEMAQRVGVAGALALSSGTAALHLALLELGAGPGNVVIVPSMTFAATANAVMYTGAEPVFVDSDEDANVDPEILLDAVETLQAEGRRIAAVLTVDLFGRCVDYDAIVPELTERGIPLLEDAAEALGASYQGAAAGSFGVAAAISFNGNKIMTTSGGGMLLSDDPQLLERCRYLSTQARQPAAHYEHTEVGYNYRLSNLLAALGRGQLRRLDEMIARRRAIRARYQDALGSLPGVRLLGGDDVSEDNCWLSCVEVDPTVVRTDVIAQALDAANIESRPLWKPMHLQPVFARNRMFGGETSTKLFTGGLALPSSPELGEAEIDRVIATFRSVVEDWR